MKAMRRRIALQLRKRSRVQHFLRNPWNAPVVFRESSPPDESARLADFRSARASARRFGWIRGKYPAPSIPTHRYLVILTLAITFFCVTSCATLSSHEFSQPTADWQTKAGQLMYRSPKTTLIGDALVRFSKTGDFELTVSKGPGITLLSLRQDAAFAEVKGAFARQGWSGRVQQAPAQLRGWLGLRDQFVHSPDQKIVRYAYGNETFVFRF
jgi:hypothetical protein